jgi:hypothetical protein
MNLSFVDRIKLINQNSIYIERIFGIRIVSIEDLALYNVVRIHARDVVTNKNVKDINFTPNYFHQESIKMGYEILYNDIRIEKIKQIIYE